VNAFNSIRGINGIGFGKGKGVSDGNEGVQWNVSANNKIGIAKLGVNLEGKVYKNWPISTFID
jgi:hypothetical protein